MNLFQAARSGVTAAICGLLIAPGLLSPARAEVSPLDGYGPGGAYQVHVELVPYFWLPATNATVKLGNGATANINSGMPTVSQLTSVLTGAFTGLGLVRYGPWSGELNIDYIGVAQSKTLGPDVFGVSRSLHISSSVVRVAPGIGYQVFNGAIGGIPATLDARVGFSYFKSGIDLDLDRFGPLGRERVSSISQSGSFVQPWLGIRAAIYPWPRWRFELGAIGQGFGVGGGTWGWQVTATASWAATRWLNLIGGFAALNESGNLGASRAVKSVSTTSYGPLLALGFTF